jgi:hypothetical protein
MKKQTLNTFAKRFFLGNILAAALFITAQAKANTLLPNNASHFDSTTSKLDLKYVGIINEGLEFDVKYNNTSGKYFSFVIKDENGDILFEQMYNNKQFFKKVQLPQVGDVKFLTFTIVSDKNKLVQRKDIKITTNIVEDVLVSIN